MEHALKELMENDAARVRLESTTFQRAYQLKTLISLPENASEEFLAQVEEIVNAMFPA